MNAAVATRAHPALRRKAARRSPRAALPRIALRPGVTWPDWDAAPSGAARAALRAIFETLGGGRSLAGFGPEEDDVLRAILASYAEQGFALGIRWLAQKAGFPAVEVRRLLERLAARDLLVLDRDSGNIRGAYPFTDRASGHRVTFGERTANAMCAVDALGVGAMLGKDTVVESFCAGCGCEVRAFTTNDGLSLREIHPAESFVWMGLGYDKACAATSLCLEIVFFCSAEHWRSWRAGRNGRSGVRLSAEEALRVGRALFAPLLATARPVQPNLNSPCDSGSGMPER